MWKPGSDKPASASPAKKTTTTGTSTPDSTKKRKTELSGVTRNMRFMQRGRTPPEPAKPQKIEPMEDDTNTTTAVEDTNQLESVETSVVAHDSNMMATPADMYGIEGAIALGRRSFGGFNTVVAENWFRQKQEIFPKPKRKGSSQTEDLKILKQFEQLEREQEGRKRSGKKKQKNGISNGNNKRTKTLEDVLAMTSP